MYLVDCQNAATLMGGRSMSGSAGETPTGYNLAVIRLRYFTLPQQLVQILPCCSCLMSPIRSIACESISAVVSA